MSLHVMWGTNYIYYLCSSYWIIYLDPCTTVSAPDNGSVVLYSDGATTKAMFSCETGSTLKGKSTITCRADGSWDIIEPSCGIKHCTKKSGDG